MCKSTKGNFLHLSSPLFWNTHPNVFSFQSSCMLHQMKKETRMGRNSNSKIELKPITLHQGFLSTNSEKSHPRKTKKEVAFLVATLQRYWHHHSGGHIGKFCRFTSPTWPSPKVQYSSARKAHQPPPRVFCLLQIQWISAWGKKTQLNFEKGWLYDLFILYSICIDTVDTSKSGSKWSNRVELHPPDMRNTSWSLSWLTWYPLPKNMQPTNRHLWPLRLLLQIHLGLQFFRGRGLQKIRVDVQFSKKNEWQNTKVRLKTNKRNKL